MSSYSQRTLQLVHNGAPPEGGVAVAVEGELEREALRRERAYQESRERNRQQATRRAGNVLQEAVTARRKPE